MKPFLHPRPARITLTPLKAALFSAGILLSAAVRAESTANQVDSVYREDVNGTVKKEPLRINPGDKRPADQFKVDILGHPLTIGGAYELEPRYTEDRRLDPSKDDDIANVSQDLKLELFYQWSKSLSFFVQSNVFYDPDVYAESRQYDKELGVRLTQAWLFIHRLLDSGFSLQVGRQRMADKRQWWWNDQLDAARLYFGEDKWFAEIALAREFDAIRSDRDFVEPLNDRVVRLLGDVMWQWDPKQNISLFFLTQFDNSDNQHIGDVLPSDLRDVSDGDLTWLGLRAMGKVKLKPVGKFAYWLDSAIVFGEESLSEFDDVDNNHVRVDAQRRQQVLAWGMDAGLTWYSNWLLEPYFTLGYAYGSGDANPNDGTNHNYRQSGIHNNKVKLSGSQRFRYYGELFRPELSNMRIMTAALGFPLSEHSSIDLLYHHYQQASVSGILRDSRIRATPDGKNGHLGDEVDLVLSLDEWKHLQVQLAGSVFVAGAAFGSLAGNPSYQLDLTFKYSF